jgi:hypothetical protein
MKVRHGRFDENADPGVDRISGMRCSRLAGIDWAFAKRKAVQSGFAITVA